jgi:hypothetical protein
MWNDGGVLVCSWSGVMRYVLLVWFDAVCGDGSVCSWSGAVGVLGVIRCGVRSLCGMVRVCSCWKSESVSDVWAGFCSWCGMVWCVFLVWYGVVCVPGVVRVPGCGMIGVCSRCGTVLCVVMDVTVLVWYGPMCGVMAVRVPGEVKMCVLGDV